MKMYINLKYFKNLNHYYRRLIALKFTYLTCKVLVQKKQREELWIQRYPTIRLIPTSVYP